MGKIVILANASVISLLTFIFIVIFVAGVDLVYDGVLYDSKPRILVGVFILAGLLAMLAISVLLATRIILNLFY